MKLPRILGLVFALHFTFGAPALWAQADVKPGVAQGQFRLRFITYDGDPRRDAPEKFEFQINTIDLKQPSEFLKLGNKINGTPWKISGFAYKTKKNAATGELEDVSELTVTHTETGQVQILVLNHVHDVNAPAPKK
jgi:hypothetical protein